MTPARAHRLEGLTADNLLAFLSLLGLLRCLEASRPGWWPQASWTVDTPPLRPSLHTSEPVSPSEVVTAAAAGLNQLAIDHCFPAKDLKLPRELARKELQTAAAAGGYRAELWSSLTSDATQGKDPKHVEATLLCLQFGNSNQHFLDRLDRVAKTATPEKLVGRKRTGKSEAECLSETLFVPWSRSDPLKSSFRWDPAEDVRYALRARNPSTTVATTQYGANRLAAIGLSALTVVPRRVGGDIRLAVRGGLLRRGRRFLTWPIWRHPASLASIRALMTHPRLDNPGVRSALGIVEVRETQRISRKAQPQRPNSPKIRNFTRAVPVIATIRKKQEHNAKNRNTGRYTSPRSA